MGKEGQGARGQGASESPLSENSSKCRGRSLQAPEEGEKERHTCLLNAVILYKKGRGAVLSQQVIASNQGDYGKGRERKKKGEVCNRMIMGTPN